MGRNRRPVRLVVRDIGGDELMLYFVNWDGDMSKWPAWYGLLRSPRKYWPGMVKREAHRLWCGDNDAFHGLFSPDAFLGMLDKMRPYADRCVFVACPDVVGDCAATLELWCEWAGQIMDEGYVPAFVCQDGQDPETIPAVAEVLFIGGSTEFKMGAGARACIAEGKKRVAWVHVGRVNSQRRLAYFSSLGVDSSDGTTINRGPEVKRRLLDSQLNQRSLQGTTR